MYELRKASNDFKFQMEEELRKADDADQRKKEEARLAALTLAAPADSQVPDLGPGAPALTPYPAAGTIEAVPEAPVAGTPATDAPAPIESPYPEEAVYPSVIAVEPAPPAGNEAVIAANALPAEAPANESIPVPEQAHHA
jgi:sec-independent protein translocase protein TatB